MVLKIGWFHYFKSQKISIIRSWYIIEGLLLLSFQETHFNHVFKDLSMPKMLSITIYSFFYFLLCFCYNFFWAHFNFLAVFYEGYVRVILGLLVPYPGLHPYNGGFNLASGLLFISCNTQLHKTTFSDIQMLSGFSFILCKSQLLKHLLRHTYAQNKKKGHGINFYVQ